MAKLGRSVSTRELGKFAKQRGLRFLLGGGLAQQQRIRYFKFATAAVPIHLSHHGAGARDPDHRTLDTF